jgi:hypothetical protein
MLVPSFMPIEQKVTVYTLHGQASLGYPRQSGRGMSVEDEQHKHLRKAAPADIPLKRTLKWMENLPAEVQPNALLRLYARVANLIAATWQDARAFGTYMESLINDKRGNRRGFPPAVRAELMALKHYYETRSESDNDVIWHHIGKRD